MAQLEPRRPLGEFNTIEVICGSMFSGKSEELIRRLRRAMIARQNVRIFKPLIDGRYDEDHIVSHNQQRLPSTRVPDSAALYAAVGDDTHVVGVDEAQFFDEGLVDVCDRLAAEGHRVIVAGLDKDFRGEPFEPIPGLLAIAEYITNFQRVTKGGLYIDGFAAPQSRDHEEAWSARREYQDGDQRPRRFCPIGDRRGSRRG